MSALRRDRMTVEEFLAFAAEQGGDERWELVDGHPVKLMAAETLRHNRAKSRIWRQFGDALARVASPCETVIDGASLRIDNKTVRVPDVSIDCGEIDPDSIWLDSPVVLVEVVSPGSVNRDEGQKLIEYFRVPSVSHYLVVYTNRQVVVHHHRLQPGATIETHFVDGGELHLSPPGIAVPVASFFDPIAPPPAP